MVCNHCDKVVAHKLSSESALTLSFMEPYNVFQSIV